MENWKSIYEGRYDVSDHGRVRSWFGSHRKKRSKPYYLKSCDGINGYLCLNLCLYKRVFHKHIHRLVLETFGPPQPSPAHECAHDDGNRFNNHISNLMWKTRKENCLDIIRHGTSNKGEKNGHAKLNTNQIIQIRQRFENGETQRNIAKDYDVGYTEIFRIVHRIYWKHIK